MKIVVFWAFFEKIEFLNWYIMAPKALLEHFSVGQPKKVVKNLKRRENHSVGKEVKSQKNGVRPTWLKLMRLKRIHFLTDKINQLTFSKSLA